MGKTGGRRNCGKKRPSPFFSAWVQLWNRGESDTL
jgi:hypothetical protein